MTLTKTKSVSECPAVRLFSVYVTTQEERDFLDNMASEHLKTKCACHPTHTHSPTETVSDCCNSSEIETDPSGAFEMCRLCGKSCSTHKSPTETTVDKWERDFDKQFVGYPEEGVIHPIADFGTSFLIGNPEDAKDFIRHSVQEAKAEERERIEDDLDKTFNRLMNNPDFKKEWEK